VSDVIEDQRVLKHDSGVFFSKLNIFE